MTNLDLSQRDQLMTALDTMSKEDVEAAIQALPGGVDAFLDGVFARMQEAFNPAKAGSQSADVQYELGTPDGPRSYVMHVADGAASVERGSSGTPKVTLKMDLVDFLKLITGKLSGMQAYMTGKLKASGDLFFAQTYQSWFNQP
jgi:putative sterol carrier protein